MSTYITAICAGPYHEVRDSPRRHRPGHLRAGESMKQYLDADDLFLITKQGFDFFHEQFGVRYPLPKYDQLWVPEFNAGAMENFGCVTHAEQHYIFRSQVTDFEYEQRANTILHEMAHMWFGDLVTMRWWDDLWLNESFAEWASHWCNTHATRFTDAWTTFLSIRKNWGYRQDQLSSTHPVYCEMPDVEAVEVNFDGITYAKGASVIKQLVAYVGIDAFVDRPARLLRASTPGATPPSTTCSPRWRRRPAGELREFAAQWLETAQVNTLRPEVEIGADGTYTAVAVRQEAPAGLPDAAHAPASASASTTWSTAGSSGASRSRWTVSGARTELTELAGVPAADVLLLNDEDLTLRQAAAGRAVDGHRGRRTSPASTSSLARALVLGGRLGHGPRRRAGRPRLRGAGLRRPARRDRHQPGHRDAAPGASGASTNYADPAWAPTGWADARRRPPGLPWPRPSPAADSSSPGPGRSSSAARTDADLAVLRGWLAGDGVPAGLAIDTELRWSMLAGAGRQRRAPAPAEIDAELDGDRTASGERAGRARATRWSPTAGREGRDLAAPDRRTRALPNWLQRSLLQGFQHPSQVELTAPYVPRVLRRWSTRSGRPGTASRRRSSSSSRTRRYRSDEQTVAADRRVAGRRRAARRAAPAGRRGPRRRGPGARAPGPRTHRRLIRQRTRAGPWCVSIPVALNRSGLGSSGPRSPRS